MALTKFPLLLAAGSLAFVAACDGSSPNDNQNARQGALIGAGVGALTGILTGDSVQDRRRGAVFGAALGAAGGAAIGNQLDQQEEELRAALGNNVGIVNNGQNLTVTLAEDILFATESTAVSAASQAELQTFAGSINRFPDTSVSVIGHTDNTGSAEFNLDLSQRRAQAVSSVLIGSGVSPTRIGSIGRGEDAPVATNLTEEGRQANRRVEVVIIPNG